MRVLPGSLPGLLHLKPTPITDERGFFSRTWTAELAERLGLPAAPDHEAVAFNPHAYTLRGLHYQDPPWAEPKRVRCVRGAIWDVVVDLRSGSPTFLKWEAVELTEDTLDSLYIPPGLAHGYLSLSPNSCVEYALYKAYHPTASTGIRWNDPRLSISWPHPPALIGSRDQQLPFLPEDFGGLLSSYSPSAEKSCCG